MSHPLPDHDVLGKFNPPTYSNWLGELRALFPVPDEFELAAAIYSFSAAFEDGMTPQQAYDDFDQWVTTER